MRMLHTRIIRRRNGAAAAALLLSSVLAGAAFGDDEAVVDPPDRVARVSFANGAVSLLAADTDEWVDATLNRPLTNGDKLWVDRDARAELQAGTATIHLDENTGFSFVALDDDVMQINLSDGAMAIEVRSLEPRERIEIDTPNAAVFLSQAGDYTISTEAAGDRTIVKTHAGEAVVSGADQHEFIVSANEQGVFSGNQELTAETSEIGGRGPFETWAYQRNHAETGSVAARYVAPGVVGYQDLDAYGTWAYESDYGQVWQPTTLIYSDWAPYRYGHWVWIAPWGWTWIDDAPWGFAPFHYGRWVYLRQRWCWLPGPLHARPVYAPALVAWSGNPRAPYGPYMGFANNVSNDVAGRVGWFPLGPREVFMPGYRTTWAHFRAINASNAAFSDNASLANAYYGRDSNVVYRNSSAITVVDGNAFASSQRTAPHRIAIDPADVANWQAQPRPPAITPTHEAMLGARPVGRDPTPRLDRQITIVHDDDASRRRSDGANPGTQRVWQGSSLANTPDRPAPAGTEAPAAQGAGVTPRSVDRPQTDGRTPFHYNGAYQNNGAFQNNGSFHDNGRYQADRPPADAQTRNRATPPPNPPSQAGSAQHPNAPTQPREPAAPIVRPDAERRPMPVEPQHRDNAEIRQAPHEEPRPTATTTRPASAPTNGRTMGRTSNIDAGEPRGHIGNEH